MIVVDVETTGLNIETSDIVSIGACTLDGSNRFYCECSIYHWTTISQTAMQINGFNELDLYTNSDKVNPVEAYRRFLDWATKQKETLLAGHNIAAFDALFLQKYHRILEFQRQTGPWPFGFRYVDLHSIGWSVLGKSLSMDGIRKQLGLEPEPKPHTALKGALCEREALLLLLDRIKSDEDNGK